ncbi:MAG: Tad domain-containing protein [Paenibacillaceae bacterium]
MYSYDKKVLVHRLKAIFHRQQGSSIVLIGLAMAMLLAMTGLVVDLGGVYVAKTQLQKAANAAALSGAQELTHNETTVRNIVIEVLSKHGERDSLAEQQVEMGHKVFVRLHRPVTLVFSGLFGWDEVPVEVKATAVLENMGRATGVAPLGIDDSIPLVFGQEYRLKVDETEVDNGNFGILALGGPGSNTYEMNLKYGYQNEIKVGSIIDTQTGNVVGKTKTGVQERINQCPYPVGETYHRDCARVILIPVYIPYNVESNQVKQVKITGFAYFYISAPMDDHDKTIKGFFIERAGTGFNEPNAGNNGAYSIRLTE